MEYEVKTGMIFADFNKYRGELFFITKAIKEKIWFTRIVVGREAGKYFFSTSEYAELPNKFFRVRANSMHFRKFIKAFFK